MCPDIYGQFGRIEVVLVEDKYDKFTIPVQGTALVNIDELAKVLSWSNLKSSFIAEWKMAL